MNNDAINVILARRSVRKYEDKPVEREKIDRILECACAAPSAINLRPWHFVEITERGTLDALADAHPYGKMLTQATLAVAVCAVEDTSTPWWEQDCAAAIQNILLAATALGLGSVWLGVNHNATVPEKVREIVGIPEHVHVMGIAAIGYSAEHKPPYAGIDQAHIHKGRW
ncbi:MAG: nitroreductase family protein [Synergistaceae bacterium]|nr:nitroreductase family protein [Synergistaceae bacterium]